MNKKLLKYLIIILILIFIAILLLFSYNGFLFFNKGFNELDYLIFNILGNALLVGIVTHISTKYISLLISKKEFNRNNKLNITINKSRNNIINFETFMNVYENDKSYFSVDKENQKIIDYVYKLYDCFLKTLKCEGVEKQLFDTILNIPFFIKYYDDENIEECYEEIIKEFDPKKKYNNISILKELLKKEDIKKIAKFSNIILHTKHYIITNLNNLEGCQLLITADNMVSCKIPCLPNNTYDVFIYYDSECWINSIAFSFDYDSKEYATNLCGFKYTNLEEEFKPAHINLKEYIKIK